MKRKLNILCSLMLALASAPLIAAPMGTAFTYQGRLTDGGSPANGNYYMLFELYDADSAGNRVATQPTNMVAVSGGLFSAEVDFGMSAFTGQARWLEVIVRTNGGIPVVLAP